jgi:hypothetical protein
MRPVGVTSGVGIIALAGIVVNNDGILTETYKEIGTCGGEAMEGSCAPALSACSSLVAPPARAAGGARKRRREGLLIAIRYFLPLTHANQRRSTRRVQPMRLFRRMLLFLFLAAPFMVLSSMPDPTQSDAYRQPEVSDLVRRVNEASALVQQVGEEAFATFRGGRWFLGPDDFYLFIFDLAGNQVLNAAFPELEHNRLDWRDAWGTPIFRLASERFSPELDNSFWWIHYLWPKPGETEDSWKSTYMVRTQAPSGQVYVVAAGLYGLAVEPLWIELLVDEAIDLIEAQGEAAFPAISSRSSQFAYLDTYVFVFNEHGVELATAGFPELIGKNLLELPDFPRKQLIREQIEFVRTHDAGWMTDSWPRPGETEPVAQLMYLKGIMHEDTLLIVGSGIYEPELADVVEQTDPPAGP